MYSQNLLAAVEARDLKISFMEHLSSNHEYRLNQYQHSLKLCNEMKYLFLSLMEIQWKLRQQHDSNFSIKGTRL